MDTNEAAVSTAVIVVVGEWAQDKPINIRIVVGGMFLAVGLSLLSNVNPKLASRFAVLILVVAAFMYVPAIAYKIGLTKQKPPDWGHVLGIVKPGQVSHGGSSGRKK